MHKNPWWLSLLAAIFISTAYYSYDAGSQLYRYFAMNQSAPAHVRNWTLEEASQGRYLVTAEYTYGSKSPLIQETLTRSFRNKWAAEESIKGWKGRRFVAWFNSSKPEMATLYRQFPMKSTVYALVLIGLLGYFLGLGYYVGKMRSG